MNHRVADLLALDEGVLARQLAAIASPVRLRIVRELAARPLQTHELQARLDEPSAGQLYHHLRELLAAGLVTQPRRSVYELPARAVIPLFTLIACTYDLATGGPRRDGFAVSLETSPASIAGKPARASPGRLPARSMQFPRSAARSSTGTAGSTSTWSGFGSAAGTTRSRAGTAGTSDRAASRSRPCSTPASSSAATQDGAPRFPRSSRTWHPIDPAWATGHHRRRLRLPGRAARQPRPRRDEGGVSRRRAARRAAHRGDRCGARTAAAPARPLPLLQPRLHRHRRRDRADHGSSLRIGARPARPRPARGRLSRLRPAARALGPWWTDAGARPPRALRHRRRCARRPGTNRVRQSRGHVPRGTTARHARGLGDAPAGLPRRSDRLPAAGDGRAICSRPLPDGATGTRSAGHGSAASTTPPSASRDRIPTGSPTALIDRQRERTAMVVCNEGRARLLRKTPELAARILSAG